MIVAIAGITGIGKTYCVNKIKDKFDFRVAKTIRTREKRKDEENISNLFLSKEDIIKLKKDDKLLYSFEVFGNTYAYLKEDILPKDNIVFEMHYSTVFDWKERIKDLITIYILPNDISITEKIIENRNLSDEEKKIRILDSIEQISRMNSDKKLFNMFDYIIYNNYDENLMDEINNIITALLKEKK